MNKIYLLLIIVPLILLPNSFSFSQTLINGGLESTSPTGNTSATPPSWEAVPFTDPNCQAGAVSQYVTPDVFTTDGPNIPAGLFGNPHSGNSFVSGLYSINHHEGIKQTVSGFSAGEEYTVSFWQALVKQQSIDHVDTTGSWAVFIDSTLAGVATMSNSLVPPIIGLNLVWEQRFVSFVATSHVHTLIFLPADDDLDQFAVANHVSGALRMGIDDISLFPGNFAGNNDLEVTINRELIKIVDALGRETVDKPNTLLIYIYSDGTSEKVFRVE